jgi:linoleoyl-CoA desaturase
MQTVPRFTASPTFYNDLRQRVSLYFNETNKAQTGNWRLWIKAIILVSTLIGSYITLVFFTPSAGIAIALCILMGLSTAGIGFNIMHDGSHGSFSKSKFLNSLAALSINVLGGNASIWNIKHNVVHHSFTNIDGVDADIDINPFLRMCKTQKHRSFHRFQHIYVVFFYSMMYFFWMFYLDYKRYFIGNVGGVPTNLSRTEHLLFWGSKLLCYFLVLVLPIWQAGWLYGIVGYFIYVNVTGFVLSLVFQLAHTVEHTEFPLPNEDGKLDNEWAIHQVQTTANFATRNPILTWFCGGLNFQIEHHLFPKVSHVHYPAISRIVRQTCAEYDLNYIEFPRLDTAVRSHWKLLYELGQNR